MKWKDEYEKTIQSIYKLFIEWENQQIIKKKMKKEIKAKQKRKKKRQVPRVRISILTGTAFAVQYSTHWAGGTCHERRTNVKIICNKWSTYCKEQVNKDSDEKGFWL